MSRARLPRRFPAFVLVAGLALAAVAATASAQPSAPDRDRRSASASTVIGGQRHLSECGRRTNDGDASDRALDACTRALEGDLGRADRITVLVNRGVVHMRRREGEAALADFDAALEINPNLPEAHVNRGAALVMLRRPGPAVAALTQALSLGVAEPYKAYYNRGAAREALGDLTGALEDYNTALDIHPEWAPAEAEVARFVRQRQQHLATALNEQGPDEGMSSSE
jgi:tetratricopeptide (TPR) repeat protein